MANTCMNLMMFVLVGDLPTWSTKTNSHYEGGGKACLERKVIRSQSTQIWQQKWIWHFCTILSLSQEAVTSHSEMITVFIRCERQYAEVLASGMTKIGYNVW